MSNKHQYILHAVCGRCGGLSASAEANGAPDVNSMFPHHGGWVPEGWTALDRSMDDHGCLLCGKCANALEQLKDAQAKQVASFMKRLSGSAVQLKRARDMFEAAKRYGRLDSFLTAYVLAHELPFDEHRIDLLLEITDEMANRFQSDMAPEDEDG